MIFHIEFVSKSISDKNLPFCMCLRWLEYNLRWMFHWWISTLSLFYQHHQFQKPPPYSHLHTPAYFVWSFVIFTKPWIQFFSFYLAESSQSMIHVIVNYYLVIRLISSELQNHPFHFRFALLLVKDWFLS